MKSPTDTRAQAHLKYTEAFTCRVVGPEGPGGEGFLTLGEVFFPHREASLTFTEDSPH